MSEEACATRQFAKMRTKTNNEKWINWLYANKSPGGSTPYILLEIFRQSALPGGDMERIFGRAIGMMHYWKAGNSWKYFLRRDIGEVGGVFLDKLKSDPNFVDSQYAEAEKRVGTLTEASIRMSKTDLKISANGLLKSLYEDVAKNYWGLGFYGVMPVVFGDFTLEPLINEYLLSLNLDPALHNEILIAFTRARKQTGMQKWMLGLDELIAEVKRSDSLSSAFKSPTIEIVSNIRGSEFYDRLIQHINQYGWVFYKWTGPMKSTDFFIDEIKSRLGKQQKPEVESLEDIVKREQQLTEKCDIDSPHMSYLGTLKTLVEMKNLKADGMAFAAYHLHRFREELVRRFGLEIECTRYMLERDILDLLTEGHINQDELRKRKELFLWIAQGGKDAVYVSKEAEKVIAKEEPQHNTTFKGNIAFPGSAVGIARIVQDYESYNGKFNRGEILVAPRTTDSYLPLFPDAGALITSEGGITSHAAQIAIEYGIPCIVGVQGIHLQLKPNSLVRMDAASAPRHGYVEYVTEVNVLPYTSRKYAERLHSNNSPFKKPNGKSVVWLSEENQPIELIGNKAANQMRLYKAYNVPEGFSITTVLCERFLEETKLKDKIIELSDHLKKLNKRDRHELEKLSREYMRMILSSNADVLEDVLNHYRKLSAPITILRSSALYEDLKGDEVFSRRSFSGIFESRVNRSERTLANVTKRIWASLFSIPSLTYSLDFGFDPTSNQMAVLVQEMIKGSRSGIIFADNNGRILIESCEGLCRPLADGEITPASYWLNQETLDVISKETSKQRFMEYIDSQGRIRRKKPSTYDPLSEKELFELGSIAKGITNDFGCAQDIEFTIQDDISYVLQNRPLAASHSK